MRHNGIMEKHYCVASRHLVTTHHQMVTRTDPIFLTNISHYSSDLAISKLFHRFEL